MEIPSKRKTQLELVKAGIDALEDFIQEIGLPTSLKQLNINKDIDLKMIADSCNMITSSYKKMTHEEILEECF